MQIVLNGRAAIVTGGSKGIGFAIATRFAASGADVAIIARGREALDRAVETIGKATKTRIIGIQGDVAIPADLERAYGEAMRAFGKIDILVNNAGTSRTGAFEEVTDEIWRQDFDEKLFAAIRVTRLVGRSSRSGAGAASSTSSTSALRRRDRRARPRRSPVPPAWR